MRKFLSKFAIIKLIVEGLPSLKGTYRTIEEGIKKTKNLTNELKEKYEI